MINNISHYMKGELLLKLFFSSAENILDFLGWDYTLLEKV